MHFQEHFRLKPWLKVSFFDFSFDMRGKPAHQARHWSDKEVFGERAFFRTGPEPAMLVLEGVRRHDEGLYRCRVDFRNTPTRSFRYNLTIVGRYWVVETWHDNVFYCDGIRAFVGGREGCVPIYYVDLSISISLAFGVERLTGKG